MEDRGKPEMHQIGKAKKGRIPFFPPWGDKQMVKGQGKTKGEPEMPLQPQVLPTGRARGDGWRVREKHEKKTFKIGPWGVKREIRR